MSAWYDVDVFRGHVREPSVGELKYIGNDLHLADIKVFGRNWASPGRYPAAVLWLAAILDWPLRLLPTLCSDIYLVGSKP